MVRRLVLATLLSAAPALACPELSVAPAVPNAFGELQLGATNVNAALGSGKLTATVSRCGELTSLKWPGPSYYDQLAYLSSNAPDARLRPHFGALDDMGAFAGIAYRTARGRGFTWLRDDDWTRVQHYSADTSDVLVTEATNAALRLHVVAYTFILPDRNVLVNHYVVTRERRSPVRHATLVYYTNFSPTLRRLPIIPLGDTALDFRNDFAVLYDRETRALLHFLPMSSATTPDFSTLTPLLKAPPRGRRALARAVSTLAAGLSEPGVYLAVGATPRDDGYQCGFDDAPICPHESAFIEQLLSSSGVDPGSAAGARLLLECSAVVADPAGPLGACRAMNGWTYQAENAFTDATDGRLSRSPIAACQANAALARRLRFRRGRATATFDVAAGATRDEANTLLAQVRAEDPDAERTATESWWSDYLAPAHLPDTDDDAVLTFARRALITIRTATDDASGAIVASVATELPYGFDWPRDGSFIDYALDLAGYPDVVSRHNRFYARVQRREYSPWSIVYSFVCPSDPAARHYPDCVPPGTFESNYYADPDEAVAGTPFSFEIDEAGLAVWALWSHAHYVTDPAARAAYLADVCPAIERGAVNLAACRDPATGLQCAASEDDNMTLTQGLQGAEAVLLALESAGDAAPDCGFPTTETTGWQARATELAQAIVDHFLVAGPPEHFEGNRPAWMLWPVTLLSPSDPRATTQAQYLNDQFVAPILSRTATGGAYNAESLLALAQLARARGDQTALAAVQDAVRFFVRELPTPDTHHLGEFYARVDLDLNGDGVGPDYLSENDVPHVWEHAYLYAAAMVAFGAR
jgi:hypothetical protein